MEALPHEADILVRANRAVVVLEDVEGDLVEGEDVECVPKGRADRIRASMVLLQGEASRMLDTFLPTV